MSWISSFITISERYVCQKILKIKIFIFKLQLKTNNFEKYEYLMRGKAVELFIYCLSIDF
jgi:hypothetical protein